MGVQGVGVGLSPAIASNSPGAWRSMEVARRVMMVEDEPRGHLNETLVELGYQIDGEAHDCVIALDMARSLRPDAVVMVVTTRALSMMQTAAALTQELIAPVVLLSAHHDREFVGLAKGAGVMAYLVTPVLRLAWLSAIEIATARFAALRALHAQMSRLQEELATHKLMERAKGILMSSRGLTEREAVRTIQRMSVKTRRPMKDIAEALVLVHQQGRSP
ncbi:MAG TPA: ANTAR domain-containing protein [Ardenticatenaceae bacterium]|nr:ANTAR domain-containing protein [Ardenticatenaceae bacterium]